MSQITASVRFIGKKPIRLMCSTSPSFTSPVYGEYAEGDRKAGWVKLTVEGLAADTLYYVRPDFSGAITAQLPVGTVRTPPVGPHSFSFAAGSCWNSSRGDKHIYDRLLTKIAANEIQFFIHMGDIHYADVQTELLSDHRNALDPVFRVSAKRRSLLSSCPCYYMYDDHDAGGPDNGDAFDPGTQGGIRFFRKAAPNPSYAEVAINKPPYYSFHRGRVRFIVTDLRNDRHPTTHTPAEEKRAMFADQDAWFKAQLLSAKAASEPVFWVSTKPWISAAYPTGDDWGGYSSHRQELVDFISANSLNNSIAILSGDMHALAYDNGTNSPGGMKVMQCAPLDQTNTTKGGPYSSGTPVTANQTQYGLINVTDSGSGPIGVRFRGMTCSTTTETTAIDESFSLGAA